MATNLNAISSQTHVEQRHRVDSGPAHGFARANIEPRPMLAADDFASNLTAPFERKIQVGAAVLEGINISVYAKE
jgi:hypothetical protein